jgi:hypothetical protein
VPSNNFDSTEKPQAFLINDPQGEFVAATTAQVAPATTTGWKQITEQVLGAAIGAAPFKDLNGLYAWEASGDSEVGLTLTRLSRGSIADAIPGLVLSDGTLGLLAVISDETAPYRSFVLALPTMIEADGSLATERTIAGIIDNQGIAYPGNLDEGVARFSVQTLGSFLHRALENTLV